MKLGLDYHGILDKYPKFFKLFIEAMKVKEHSIYIITGARLEDFKQDPLVRGITYDYFYSITDDFLATSLPHDIDDKEHVTFDSILWDSAKAIYCDNNKIDLMIDDSDIYGKYFKTPYIMFKGIKEWVDI